MRTPRTELFATSSCSQWTVSAFILAICTLFGCSGADTAGRNEIECATSVETARHQIGSQQSTITAERPALQPWRLILSVDALRRDRRLSRRCDFRQSKLGMLVAWTKSSPLRQRSGKLIDAWSAATQQSRLSVQILYCIWLT